MESSLPPRVRTKLLAMLPPNVSVPKAATSDTSASLAEMIIEIAVSNGILSAHELRGGFQADSVTALGGPGTAEHRGRYPQNEYRVLIP
jgi:hypothetical protein